MTEADKKKTKTDEAWQRLYARFQQEDLLPCAEAVPTPHRRHRLRWPIAVAAVVVGMICILSITMMPGQSEDTNNLVTQENRETTTLVKPLEDGSVVYLAQESTLQYPEHFADDKREVNLQGEAFFDVTKNPRQAFTIDTKEVRVEVLGTAFDVQSNDTTPFRLSVKRGKVKVLLKQDGQTLLVGAGETVTLQAGNMRLSKTEHPEPFNRYIRNIRFKDESLKDVLSVINRESSDWQIETASATLGQRRLTVELADNSPESVAQLICWTFNLKCVQQGRKLILSE